LLSTASRSNAAAVANYNFGISAFVQSPTQPVIYGTVPSLKSVVVINDSTLQVTNTIPIGSNPAGIAISPDGSTVYVADSGSSFIARLNTSTLATETSFVSPGGNPTQLQFGNSNRLWVLDGTGIHPLDGTTGASAGATIDIPGGTFLVSPDGNSLYEGNFGVSPSGAGRFDVSNPASPTQNWTIPGSGNGQALVLNHSGSTFAYSSGGDSSLALLDTATKLTDGSVGSRGNALAFSTNDSLVYTAINFTNSVNAWSTSTFLQVGSSIPTAAGPGVLFTDSSGHLFVGEGSQTQVFLVPEPASISLICLGFVALLGKRRRRIIANAI
jgi:YVTN family beta-propeller protein